MSVVAQERKRLRRKFIAKFATRDFHVMDRWLDSEYIKAGIPLWIAFFIRYVEDANTSAAIFALALGLLITIPWWIFITIVIFEVFARFNDKTYMRITRHYLAKEYRS